MENKIVNGYTLLRPLGKGGMAEIWYAENTLGKKAAVKLLLPKFCDDENIVGRFRNEAEVMVSLQHPNIRQAYDYTILEGRPCMIMEYLDGDDLSSRMKQGERFTDDQLRKWWGQLVSALNYTHGKGVVHRDIKPSNIFLTVDGDVKLLDFGIAKIQEGIVMTQTGATMGTLMYMSPEQVMDSKHIDHKTDLYSLAMTFVHLLTGKAPYDITTTNDYEIRKSIVEIPMQLESLPHDWQNFLRPYLSKKPTDRPALIPFTEEITAKAETHPEETFSPQTVHSEATMVENAPYQNNNSGSDPQKEETVLDTPAAPASPAKATPKKSKKDVPQKRKRKVWPWILATSIVLIVGGLAAVFAIYWAVENDVFVTPAHNIYVDEDGCIIADGENLYKMVMVEGGTFLMGATPEQGDECGDNEYPAHHVTLSDYRIGQSEVTQALWKAVMGNNPSEFKNNKNPVENVSWEDCQEFIRRLNNLTGKNFQLPTEAQWEYAARGGKNSSNYKYSGSNSIGQVAVCPAHPYRNYGTTCSVMECGANQLRLYDMSGNVWEWCEDYYDSYTSDAAVKSYPVDPKGPSNGWERVIRGGCYFNYSTDCRVAKREKSAPNSRYSILGFRLVLLP